MGDPSCYKVETRTQGAKRVQAHYNISQIHNDGLEPALQRKNEDERTGTKSSIEKLAQKRDGFERPHPSKIRRFDPLQQRIKLYYLPGESVIVMDRLLGIIILSQNSRQHGRLQSQYTAMICFGERSAGPAIHGFTCSMTPLARSKLTGCFHARYGVSVFSV